MQFGLYLVKHGLITANQFVEAVEAQLASRPQLGALAIETNRLSVKQVFHILRTQADTPHKMFGVLALEAGFLQEDSLATLLYFQSVRVRPMPQIIADLGFLAPDEVEEYFADYRAVSGLPEENNLATAV